MNQGETPTTNQGWQLDHERTVDYNNGTVDHFQWWHRDRRIRRLFSLRDSTGYVSYYDYKANREPLARARTWVSLQNVQRYLNSDSFRRLARHTTGGMVLEEIEEREYTKPKPSKTAKSAATANSAAGPAKCSA